MRHWVLKFACRALTDIWRLVQIRTTWPVIVAIVLGAFCSPLVSAQGEKLQFEAISIKPSPRWDRRSLPVPISACEGGPGTTDPSRLVCHFYPLRDLITLAYGIPAFQLSGPQWLTDLTQFPAPDAVDLIATMPSGTTKDQCSAMLRNALVERFNLKTHRETKDVSGYALTLAKRGPKLQPSDDVPGEDPPVIDYGSKGSDGFPTVPPGYSGLFVRPGRLTVLKFVRQSMDDLAKSVAGNLKRPVRNKTGLTGRYDFRLEYSRESPLSTDLGSDAVNPEGRGYVAALEYDLGLALVKEMCQVEMLVIDHVDRAPTAN